MTILTTSRLRLRPATKADLAAFHVILSDPRAMRYWSTLPHESLAVSREWLTRMRHGTYPDFAIEHRGQVIGKAGAYGLPEVGFLLHPSAWGRGFATEAMAAVIAHVFASTDSNHLTADVDPRNTASRRVLEKLGFRISHSATRTFLLGDEWCDSVYYRLDRNERPHAAP
jgi:ribosomal-protein-alanine N-acetyltransferase